MVHKCFKMTTISLALIDGNSVTIKGVKKTMTARVVLSSSAGGAASMYGRQMIMSCGPWQQARLTREGA